MQKNLKKKWNISDDEYKDAVRTISKSIVDLDNAYVKLAIAELLTFGDIESEENDDNDQRF